MLMPLPFCQHVLLECVYVPAVQLNAMAQHDGTLPGLGLRHLPVTTIAVCTLAADVHCPHLLQDVKCNQCSCLKPTDEPLQQSRANPVLAARACMSLFDLLTTSHL
jgi:hypothetical protein